MRSLIATLAFVFSIISNPLTAIAAVPSGTAVDGRVDALSSGLLGVRKDVKKLKDQLSAMTGDAEIDLLNKALARAGACIDSVSKLDVDAQEEASKACADMISQIKSALVDRHSKDPDFGRVPQTAVILGGDLRLRMDPGTGRLASLRYKREKNIPALAGTLDAPKLVPTVEEAQAASKDKVPALVKWLAMPAVGGLIGGTTFALAFPASHTSGANPDGSIRTETKSDAGPIVGGALLGIGLGAVAGLVTELLDNTD